MQSGGVNKTDTAQTAPNDTIKFTPLFGSGELKLQTTTKAVTPFAGMASFFAWLGALEFPKRAAEVMPFEYRSPMRSLRSRRCWRSSARWWWGRAALPMRGG